jgi:hypothetical protein
VGLPSGLFSSGSPKKTLHSCPHPFRSTFPTHLILLYFITLTMFGEDYRSWSSSL